MSLTFLCAAQPKLSENTKTMKQDWLQKFADD